MANLVRVNITLLLLCDALYTNFTITKMQVRDILSKEPFLFQAFFERMVC